jgi:hypothetical protein
MKGLKLIYAGIGTRNLSPELQKTVKSVGSFLYELGFTLRSGGADGSDSTFESVSLDRKEIYLPFRGFNGNDSPLYPPSEMAYHIAKEHHPTWNKLKDVAKSLHARNTHQILGISCDNPVDFVVYVADTDCNGNVLGGTGQAIRLAHSRKIRTFNLKTQLQEFRGFSKQLRAYVHHTWLRQLSILYSTDIAPNDLKVIDVLFDIEPEVGVYDEEQMEIMNTFVKKYVIDNPTQ